MMSFPPELKQAWDGGIAAMVLAWLGRMMWHVSEVQHNRRRFFSPHLLWEVFTAIAIGYIADGVASYAGLDGKPALAAIVAIAYVGPRGIEVAMQRALKVYVGRAEGEK